MQMTPIQACIFDMDGVLLDSERFLREIVLSVSKELGYTISDEVYLACVGRNERDVRTILEKRVSRDFPHDEVLNRVNRRVESALASDGWPLKPGVVEALQKILDNDLRLCVATSTAQPLAHERLTSANIRHFFEHISGGDEVARGKPDPEIFLLAAERLKLPPAECIVIEDSEYGAQGALTAGMQCVMVPDLKIPPEWIRPQLRGVFDDLESATSHITSQL
jgi:HAD superfamily hydrolase (TIGR01509 family)